MYCDYDKIPIFKFRFSYISLFSIGFAFHVYLCSTVGWASLERWASLELFRRSGFHGDVIGKCYFNCLDCFEFYMCKVLYNPISHYSHK